MKDTLKLSDRDNVAVAVTDTVNGVPKGHKLALCNIKTGERIIKYGYPIGTATADIKKGEWVHTHNLKTALDSECNYQYRKQMFPLPTVAPAFFNGYRRQNGTVGIRNEIWIIPTVGCVNKIAETIAKNTADKWEGGVYALTHPYGCSQIGDDHENTRALLSALASHPNAGGVLLLGLGCENNLLEKMIPLIPDLTRVRTLVCQQTEDEIADGEKFVNELIELCKTDKREPISVSELKVGLKCGGSDGFSGITANPLVGAFSDMIAASGGTTFLTEVPEMFGAELSLLSRCKDESVYTQTVDMIEGFKYYYRKNAMPIYENPSPGNKEGGITTLEEKSLGCVQKAGCSEITAVLPYAVPSAKKGLVLVNAPGNDLVATTALAAAGAHLVLFTTGRGTPFSGPVPTVKISTNTDLYDRKRNWIDFNAGVLLDNPDIESYAQKLFDFVLSLASGDTLTVSEKNGFRELSIFKTGVTL